MLGETSFKGKVGEGLSLDKRKLVVVHRFLRIKAGCFLFTI